MSRHQLYAEEIAALTGARYPALLRALASVRREDFLPPAALGGRLAAARPA